MSQLTEREKLIKELIEYIPYDERHGKYPIDYFLDFILEDRKRIVQPLILVMSKPIDDNATYDAIEETLRLSGVSQEDE